MYTLDQRMKAVELYIEYYFCESKVIRELGYPTNNTIPVWYEEYRTNRTLHEFKKRYSKYSTDQKMFAIDHYFKHGQCISRTVEDLGYPSRPLLTQWVKSKNNCISTQPLVDCSQTRRQNAKRCEVSMSKAKRNKKDQPNTQGDDYNDLLSEKEVLSKQVEKLQEEVRQLQLKKDVLEKAAEIIKKDQGINLESLTNREKAILINALRQRHSLKELLVVLKMAKSSYCYQVVAMKKPDKYAGLKADVINIFQDSSRRYGYRRVHSVIKTSGVVVSEKVIRRIMKTELLIVPAAKRRKYNSYKGEISPEVDNIINRDFHAERPNEKWLTDITEFHIPAGKVYLSPILDCFDGLPVAWTIGTAPDAELVNTMLDKSLLTLKDNERPIVHSDRGCHYRWPGWIERMKKANLIRSMSRKGCSPDNSACEGFFGRLKNEMFYGYSWANVTIEQFTEQLDMYIKWYAEKRIKLSLGGMSPLDYRMSLRLVI